MSSYVSEFIITPVLRQARRLSAGFAAEERPALRHRRTRSSEDAILEGDESGRTLDTHALNSQMPEASSDDAAAAVPNGFRATSSESADAELDRQSSAPFESAEVNSIATATWPLQEGAKVAPLPEDDGMGELRRKIRSIQAMAIPENRKAQMMHQLLMEKYTKLQKLSSAASAIVRPESPTARSVSGVPEHSEHAGTLQALKFWNPLGDGSGPLDLPLTEKDLAPTYAPAAAPTDDEQILQPGELPVEDGEDSGRPALGCEHYRRNVKLQCAECERWYTCRFCHDAAEDHVLPRQQTKHMLCMLCGCAQRASDSCVRCGESAAYYYCGICKLWNDDPNKPIYHCPDCGLCRVGQGLGKDFFHCKKCMACVSTSSSHKCVERSTDCDCPICGDYLFSSTRPVVFMQCGHSIHRHCFQEHMKTSYKCPLCSKSCVNMEYQFRNHDLAILNQPMPPEYRDARAVVSCNDCRAKCQTAYHWLGLKCTVCQSYNTTQLKLLNMPGEGGTERAFEEGGEIDIPFPPPSTFAPQPLPLEDLLELEPGSPLPEVVAPETWGSSDVDEEDDGDLLDLFWGRDHLDRGNAVTSESAGDIDEDEEEESSEEEGCEEEEEDDDDDDDEDEIVLVGHR